MVSTLIWRHVSLQWLFSQTFFGLLFCYLTITDVTLYLQIIDFQFPSCCTSQPKKTKLNHYCEQFYEYSYHQKNNSCTLCVPMFAKLIEFTEGGRRKLRADATRVKAVSGVCSTFEVKILNPQQKKAVAEFLSGSDVFVNLPTGYGD